MIRVLLCITVLTTSKIVNAVPASDGFNPLTKYTVEEINDRFNKALEDKCVASLIQYYSNDIQFRANLISRDVYGSVGYNDVSNVWTNFFAAGGFIKFSGKPVITQKGTGYHSEQKLRIHIGGQGEVDMTQKIDFKTVPADPSGTSIEQFKISAQFYTV